MKCLQDPFFVSDRIIVDEQRGPPAFFLQLLFIHGLFDQLLRKIREVLVLQIKGFLEHLGPLLVLVHRQLVGY